MLKILKLRIKSTTNPITHQMVNVLKVWNYLKSFSPYVKLNSTPWRARARQIIKCAFGRSHLRFDFTFCSAKVQWQMIVSLVILKRKKNRLSTIGMRLKFRLSTTTRTVTNRLSHKHKCALLHSRYENYNLFSHKNCGAALLQTKIEKYTSRPHHKNRTVQH